MGATQSHARLEPTTPTTGAPHTGEADPGEGPSALIANRYRLQERIHAGSTGTLYRAEDLAFSRPVALRLLTPALSRDEAVLARLQARLQATAAMTRDDVGASGDIIDLTDLGRTETGQVFVVTEFLVGENLATQLAREGPMPWRALRPLMVRACQIVHLSHQHALLRLDLQTRHLFPVRDKTQTSTLKVLSPGIGDVFGDSLWSSLDPAAAAGHLRYAAPEQLTGGTVDARTDIYALGVIMYELLCGRVPFPDLRPAYVCARHLLEPPPPFPHAVRASTPEAVVSIVARALAKQPEDRWPTMRALANAMAAIDFGPCDASGVLMVAHGEPPAPAASSTSMRIDVAALHAPSPTVRPKTMPPIHGVTLAELEASAAAVVNAQIPVSTTIPAPAPAGAVGDRPVRSARLEPDPQPWFRLPEEASGSSSRMAWDEILAAAEEAVAAVAGARHSGTAGDSDVFLPQRLLHTGEAATESMQGRRLEPEPESAQSLANTLIMPVMPFIPSTLVREPAGLSTTHQRDVDALTGDSGGDLLGTSATDLSRSDDAALDLVAGQFAGSGPAGPAPADSAVSMREVAERSATVWPIVAARSQISARPASRRTYAWAAAAVLALGTAGASLRLLRPREVPAPTVATPSAVADAHVEPMRRAAQAIPAAIAPRRGPGDRSPGLSSGTGASSASERDPQWIDAFNAAAAAAPNLSPGTAPAPLPSPGDLSQGPGDLSPKPADPRTADPAPKPTDPRAIDLSAEPSGSAANAVAGPPAATRPAKTSPEVPRGAAGRAPRSVEPPMRKSIPGAHLPDAGHELAAPLDHDPLHAASLLEKAEQAARRGERALALSLAIKSYHAQPSANALRVAGELACTLGDAGKARWARDHLAASERAPVDAACKAADLALD